MNRTAQTFHIVAAGLMVACATPRPRDPGHDRPLSVVEHMAEAERHDREAGAHQGAYEGSPAAPHGIECIDQPLAGIPYSGTEPIRIMRPCWTVHQGPSEYDLAMADVHRRAAAQHRAQAVALVRAERRACAGMGEEEISHSPFYHREDVAAVVALEDDGRLRGARVTFRRIPGLTPEWLRQAVLCHRTRAAVMGYSGAFMAYCPLGLEGVAAEVSDGGDGPVVTLRADREDVAAEVLRRAEALLRPNGPDERG